MIRFLPNELSLHIYSFLLPIGDKKKIKYKYSVIWCKNCGELLSGDDWMLHMNTHAVSTTSFLQNFMLYTCEKCKYDNIYFNDDEWHILLDYIN